jgi:signal transduction histidine kinase
MPISRILIVDDEPANVALLEIMLQTTREYETRSTNDPREALPLVKEFEPDLILLDLSMPHINGFGVMEQLRALLPPGSYLPVLVLTADATRETKQRALAGGAHDFLTKPFENQEVLLRCRNLLQTRALHQALQRQNALLEETVRERTRTLEQTLVELKAAQQSQVEQERLRALGEMSSGIAHDFNNQLTVLVGYTELLLLNDAQILNNKLMATRYLQTIRTAAHDSAGIVGRLREFYRQREAEDIFLPLDLSRLVRETATLTQPKWRNQARAAGCKVSVRLDLATLPDVSANAAELREVVTNLIFNAVDAMPQGGEITLRTRRAGDRAVLFEVADSGIGMTEEVRRRCLEPFFTTKDARGSGLGLSVVYGIIKRHEGHLDILTEPGGGTTVTIRLPVAQGHVPVAKTGAQTGGSVGLRLRVLVVEDDEMVRDVVCEYLRRDGHEVSTAVSGREGLEKFGAGGFDLVITDLALEEMNGQQMASEIKARQAGMPIILLTGFADTLLASGEKPDGIDIVLRKPLLPGDLWRAVAQVTSAQHNTQPETVPVA